MNGRAGGLVGGWPKAIWRQSGEVNLAKSGDFASLVRTEFCFFISLITMPMMDADDDAGHMMPYHHHQTGMQHPTRKRAQSNIHAHTQNPLEKMRTTTMRLNCTR